MPTKTVYKKLSLKIRPHKDRISLFTYVIAIGGFFFLVALGYFTGDFQTAIGIGGKVWFSMCAVMMVLRGVAHSFDTEPQPAEIPFQDYFDTLLFNLVFVVGVMPWFW